MQWFLVALSFSLPGEAPEAAARPMGLGPGAQVSCELEVALHESIGSQPHDFSALDNPELFCLDVLRLCQVRPALRVAVPDVIQASAKTATRQADASPFDWHCAA